jgi:signal transduction histidine kinase
MTSEVAPAAERGIPRSVAKENIRLTGVWWLIIGLLIGVAAMLPVLRLWTRRAERRARRAERRARDAERLAERGAMTSGLAHEIKNPLSTIGLNAQLLAEAIDDAQLPVEERDRLRRRVDSLSREAERLGGILADFLQFAGRIKLDPQPKDLSRIVDELCDFFHPQCVQHGVTLRTRFPDQPLMVKVDEGLFKQALLNLLLNAVQAMMPRSTVHSHTDAGRHEQAMIKELILRIDSDDGEARVHVIDTGPGIPPDKLDEIFHPYISHKAGGTGLGLPTARRIIEEHGGRLEAHSEPGRGSDFVIHLPLSR